MPEETGRHLRAYCVERLRAARSLIDKRIEKIEEREKTVLQEEQA